MTTEQQTDLGVRLLHFLDNHAAHVRDVQVYVGPGFGYLVVSTDDMRDVAMTLISQNNLKRLLGGRDV